MRTLLTFIILLLTFVNYGQNQIQVKKATVTDQIIYKGDSLGVWEDSAGTMYSRNTGNLQFQNSYIKAPNLTAPAGKYSKVLVYDAAGYFVPQPMSEFYDTMSVYLPAGSSAFQQWEKDTAKNILYPADSASQIDIHTVNEQYLSTDYEFYTLNWKKQLHDAYEKEQQPSILLLGDSYGWRYGLGLKGEATKYYGYGGGYENFYTDVNYTDNGYIHIETTNWAYASNRADDYNIVSRELTSSTDAATVVMYARRFNKIRICYEDTTGGGDFSVKINTTILDTISTDGTPGINWWSYDLGANYSAAAGDDITITKIGTKKVSLYGHDLAWDDDGDYKQSSLRVHIMTDGGARFLHYYDDKNGLAAKNMLDSLDLGLIGLTFLENTGSNISTEANRLIDSLQIWAATSDILLIGPHDATTVGGLYPGWSLGEQWQVYDSIAKYQGIGWINSYREFGSITDLDAVGWTTDDIHLTFEGTWLTYILLDKLIPKRNKIHLLESDTIKTTDFYSTGVGRLDGNFLFHNTGTFSEFFGNAGNLTTTTNSSTALGYFAGKSLTSGGFNTIIGSQAGEANTTGTSNVFIGYKCGEANQTGVTNVYIGRETGKNASGSGNVFIGSDAAEAVTTGVRNTIIGTSALATATTQSYNTIFGYTSGYLTTGGYNLFFGNRAGYNETGSYKSYWAADSTRWANGMASGSKLLWYADMSNAAKSNHFMNIFAKVAIGEAKALSAYSLEVVGNANFTTYIKTGTATIADNDSTPSVAGGNTLIYNGTANSVSIDALDDHVVGVYYTIIGNSNTYTITVIDGTPAGGDSFNLAGGNWVGGSQDVLVLYCIAADAFIEVSRSDN